MTCPDCALPLPDATVPGRSVVRCTRCGWLGAVPPVEDEPAVPIDLDAFDRWACTGEGDPWSTPTNENVPPSSRRDR